MCAGVDVAVPPGPRVAHVGRQRLGLRQLRHAAGCRGRSAGRGSGADSPREPRLGRRRSLRSECGTADRDQPVVARPEPGRLARRLHDHLAVQDVEALLVGVHVRRHRAARREPARARSRCARPAVARVDDRPAPLARPSRPADPPAAPRRASVARATRWSVIGRRGRSLPRLRPARPRRRRWSRESCTSAIARADVGRRA